MDRDFQYRGQKVYDSITICFLYHVSPNKHIIPYLTYLEFKYKGHKNNIEVDSEEVAQVVQGRASPQLVAPVLLTSAESDHDSNSNN